MKPKYYAALMGAMVALMMIVAPLRASAVTDDQIVSSAKDSYVFKTFLKGDDIKVESRNGVVTLSGVVAGPARKLLAEMTVTVMPGVKKVDNRLTVKGEEPTANSDAWIKDKVETTLELHRSVNDSKIEVSVKDGIVTLTGIAASQAKKELATAYAEDVEGVKDVKNKMTVDGSWKATYNKAADYIDDASITAQVKYTLLSHRSTSALKTKVETTNGVVTLSGKADNQAEKTLATLLANDINGVQAVRNQMTIE
jgi:hyperosmotically inducible protein